MKRVLCPGDIVVMRDDGSWRGFWRLARVEQLIKGTDGQVRGAAIHVSSKGDKRPAMLRCPVTHFYPLEINCCVENTKDTVDGTARSVNPVEPTASSKNSQPVEDPQPQSRQPRRAAAEKARQWMQAVLSD